MNLLFYDNKQLNIHFDFKYYLKKNEEEFGA